MNIRPGDFEVIGHRKTWVHRGEHVAPLMARLLRGDLVRIQRSSAHHMVLEHSIFKFACNSLPLNDLLLHACKMLVSGSEEEVRAAGPVLQFAVKFPGDIKGGELFFSLYVLFPAFLLSSFPFSHTREHE